MSKARTPKGQKTAKTPAAGKTAAGEKKRVDTRSASSGRAAQPAKRTKAKPNTTKKQSAKQENPKQKKKESKEQRVLIHGVVATDETGKMVFPKKFPFWARLKISKNRTTLVIDEEKEVYNKQKKRKEEGFVHREAIHPNKDGSNVKGYEKIEPNPDKTDNKPMYLKNPSKLPKALFKPHNKDLDMPEHLKEKYDKNNHKKDK